MTCPRKRKGDAAELEAARLLSELTGLPVRRKLGAGRLDDTGDLDGIPRTVLQVANWSDRLRAVREKPLAAELQRLNDGADFAAALVRFRGKVGYRVVMTPEQFAALVIAALLPRASSIATCNPSSMLDW
ncbi:hypothetical protein KBZ18_10035 [Synechococcus sp. Cruz-9H2]|uniref:hypothetical protein n=1 Tax=unclassified Synechococcus TaxID=2626047 RepID=UPI0020CC7093|nr:MULTISPECIES: hypothetical protein [unclassified Synechococcus]MCP9819831.1 hypothetical protein [Synechococcus sp. Cruz-9H2]MCP9844103.1 hypothetical protein [Synechococcus sp. Edmonson 11F2]MCP9856261.1 hypothetical protein [Synechococcus sp. Cruz-9C9]MCP9863546.1 hypothetical protein [Synechococcus sp. Cruz-7E5]MCP9870742.1 hypothetical protein [Synechococcus sp. Cruz-7B9]